MEFLRNYRTVGFKGLVFALLASLSMSCSDTVTQVINLETDTFISNTDPSDHSEYHHVQVSLSGSDEERVILKLPTGEKDKDENLKKAFEDVLKVFILPLAVLIDLLDCDTEILTAENLTSAKLVLDIKLSQENGSLSNKLELLLLNTPWWHTATWDQAHPFSSDGNWSTAGGDISPSFGSILGTENNGQIEFDITNYFQGLISNQESVHYGFVIRSAASQLGRISFFSAQSILGDQRPRLVSTYTGTCNGTVSGVAVDPEMRQKGRVQTTRYLGKDRIVVTETI